MSYEVFISHSSKDKKVADVVCGYLEQQKLRCWIAPRDLQPGEKWATGIIAGLDQCHAMVLVFSENSNKSGQVAREVERAAAKGTTIFPLRIDNSALSPEMEYFISNTHWLDALTEPVEEHLEKLYRSVRVHLEVRAGHPVTPQAAAAQEEQRPDGPAVDVLLWVMRRFSRRRLKPMWDFIMRLSPAYRLLLGGILSVIVLLIIISDKVGPPSDEKLRLQMNNARRLGEDLTKDMQEIQRVNDALGDLYKWPYGQIEKSIVSDWWLSESRKFQKEIAVAGALRGDAADKEIARLSGKKAELDQWVKDWQRIQPPLSTLIRRIRVRGELAKYDKLYAKDMAVALREAAAAEKAVSDGNLRSAEEKLATAQKALPAGQSQIEEVVAFCVEKGVASYQPELQTPEDLTALVKSFWFAWHRDYRGLHLGMTGAGVSTWAASLGATWVVLENIATPDTEQRNSTAAKAMFVIPGEDNSEVFEQVTLKFTPHLSASAPSIVHDIAISGALPESTGRTGLAHVEARYGKPVRMDGGTLLYSGGRLQSLARWNQFVPDFYATQSGQSFNIHCGSNELRELYYRSWQAIVDKSATTADLPVNPLLSGPRLKVNPKAFRLMEEPFTITADMPRVELEAQATSFGRQFSNNGSQLFVYLVPKTDNGIRALCRDRTKPDTISHVDYKTALSKPMRPLEAIQSYVQRYGPPLKMEVAARYAMLNYSSDNAWDFQISLGFQDGSCTAVQIQAGYDP